MERLSIDEVIEHCKRFISRYNKEVVEKVKDIRHCSVVGYWEHKQVKEWLEELKAYRQAEEQGLLFRLPCKVGDTVYLAEHDRLVFRDKPLICIVDEFSISATGCYVILNANEPFYALHRFNAVDIKDFGKIVFLTKEEAEQKLAEMKGE